jgi:alkylation response protein AidB-like acyl-CoA dehydrogenase
MTYRAPVVDYRFLLTHVLDFAAVTATARFGDATPETVDAILTEAARLCETTLAPLNRGGDKSPAVLENGVVRTSPGYAAGFRAIADGGWIGLSADPAHGGMGLPMTLNSCVNEMMGAACLALQLNPMLTQGQIEALEHHASDQIKALYLPKLISGEWNGTMNLTEPQAGSDVGALKSRAEPRDDRYSSPGATATSWPIPAIWSSPACPMLPLASKASRCSWSPSSCPMTRATPVCATRCMW